jgi:hypothetical protein
VQKRVRATRKPQFEKSYDGKTLALSWGNSYIRKISVAESQVPRRRYRSLKLA